MSSAGVIAGTIDNSASQGGDNGVYEVTISARDPLGAETTQTFDWTVTNPAPDFVGENSDPLLEDTYAFTVAEGAAVDSAAELQHHRRQ